MSIYPRTLSGLVTINCDLLTAVRAEIQTLVVDSITISSLVVTDLTVTDLVVTGSATIPSLTLTDLTVTNMATTTDLTVTGTADIATLNATTQTSTDITTTNLTVTGTATLPSLSFTNLNLSGTLTVGGLTTLNGNATVNFNTDNVVGPTIKNLNAGSSAGAVLYLQTDSANSGVIFKNSSTRSADGGVDTMTVRNDGGTLRLMAGTGSVNVGYNTGDFTATSTTASTSTTTGSAVFGGGIGVAGAANIGGPIATTDTTPSTSTTTGSIKAAGGLGVVGAGNFGGVVKTIDTTASTSTTTGSGVFGGGVGAAGAIYGGGLLNIATTGTFGDNSSVTASKNGTLSIAVNNSSNGSSANSLFHALNDSGNGLVIFINSTGKTTDGGASNATIRNDIGTLRLMAGTGLMTMGFNTGDITVESTTASSSTTTGALVVKGGLGVAGAINSGSVSAATITGTTSGSFTLANIGGTPNAGLSGSYRVLRLSPVSGTSTQITFDQSTGTGTGQSFIYNDATMMEFSAPSYKFDTNPIESTGTLYVNNSTASTSTTTGAITTPGGLGVGKAIWGGDLLNIATTGTFGDNSSVTASKNGTLSLAVNNSSNGSSANSLVHAINDSGNGLVIFINGTGKTSDGGASNATVRNDIGRLRLMAGSGEMYIDFNTGDITSTSTTQASYTGNTGAIRSQGGILADKIIMSKEYLAGVYADPVLALDTSWTYYKIIGLKFSDVLPGDATYLYSAGSGGSNTPCIVYNQSQTLVNISTTSTSATTGALKTVGGFGCGENINAAGKIRTYDTTQATSVSSAALVSDGGLGVAGKAIIGDELTIPSLHFTTTATSFTPTFVTNTSITYTTQNGRYLVFGPLTYIEVYIVTTSAIYSGNADLQVNVPVASPWPGSGLIPQSGAPELSNYELPASSDFACVKWVSSLLAVYISRDSLTGLYLQAPQTSATRTFGFGGWFYNL